jgi:hypothetical protein
MTIDHTQHLAEVESRTEKILQRAVAAQLMEETLEPGRYDTEAINILGDYLRMSPGEQAIAFLVIVKANSLNYLAAHPEQREAMAEHADRIVHERRASRRSTKEGTPA